MLSPTDNCTASGSIVEAQTIAAGAYGVSGDGSTVVVNYTATDAASPANTTTCTVTITVNDDDAPTFTCPTPTLVLNTTGNNGCEVTIPNLVAMVSDAADNCGLAAVPVTQSIAAGTYSGASDSNTIPVTVTVTDSASPANTTTCSYTFTVNDDDAPTFTCPTPTLVLNTTGNNGCEVIIPNLVAMGSEFAVVREGAWLRVSLEDDGAGRGQPSPQAGCGFGLAGMGERIEWLGGEFSTGRAAGGGFRIEARLPAMPSKTFEESVHE